MGQKHVEQWSVLNNCLFLCQQIMDMIMEKKLIARDRECSMLKDCMESDRSEFVIVYGRRRVGKTFLIDQYAHIMTLFQWMGIDSGALLYGLDHVGQSSNKIMSL